MDTTPDSTDDSEDSFRVNVPADAAPDVGELDSGYVLVKFNKDNGALCLDLEDMMLPDSQPDVPEPGADDSLEEAMTKLKDEAPEPVSDDVE